MYTETLNAYLQEMIGMDYEEYKAQLSNYEHDQMVLKATKYSLIQELKEYPYLRLAETQEYLDYVAAQKDNPTTIDYSKLKKNRRAIYLRNNQVNEVALARAAERGEIDP